MAQSQIDLNRVDSYCSSDSSSDESDMDLQKEMYPISHYINDREEMINQVKTPFIHEQLIIYKYVSRYFLLSKVLN